MRQLFYTLMLVLPLASMTACSSGENARPDPVDLTQFNAKSTHFEVVGAVGNPEGSIKQNGRPYDIYKIYTKGLSSGAKAAMAFGEGVTDVATLGIAEIGWSAVHAGTRPRIHTVMFGYDSTHEMLVDIFDKDPSRTSQSEHIILNKKVYSMPVILPAPPPPPLPEAGQVRLDSPSSLPSTVPGTVPQTTTTPTPSTVSFIPPEQPSPVNPTGL